MTEQNDSVDVNQIHGAGERPSPPRRWPWIASIVAAFVVGIGIGAAGGDTQPTAETPEPEVVIETQTVTETVEVPGEIPQEDLDALTEREAELDDREAELAEREAAITEAEDEAAASTFGNGVYVVGEDIEAGEYRSAGADGSNPVGCYYAFLSGTGSDADIIDNNIVEGQTRVTLRDGDVFESQSCESWERVGG
jgi:hypothetical protein